MFNGIMGKMSMNIAMKKRAGRHHFCIEPGVSADLPQEVALVAVGPIKHWRNAETMTVGRKCHGGKLEGEFEDVDVNGLRA